MVDYLEAWTPSGPKLVSLDRDRFAIGSDPSNDLALEGDGTVSGLHAVLERYPAGWALRDLGSRNATFVNGERLWAERRLRDGDEVRVGKTRIVFRSDAPARRPTEAVEPAPELTRRERDVLLTLCGPLLSGDAFTEPASMREIAESLAVGEATVEEHLTNLYDKFEIHEGSNRRVQLANQAIQRGALTPADLRESLAEALRPSITEVVRERAPDLPEHELQRRSEEVERALVPHAPHLATLTHEFRTPLMAILGYAEMLLDDDLRPDEVELSSYAQTIKDSGEHILTLVNELCDLAKIESGRLEFRPEPVAVAGVLRSVHDMLAPLAGEASLALELDIPQNLPHVLAEPARLRQIMLNLGSNAVKYTSPGGRIRVTAHVESESVVLSVADSGMGIPSEMLSRIFEPFFQVPGVATQRGQPSSGLGLAITKAIVEALGGTVSVQSVAGEGTTISVQLRRTDDHAETR